MQTAYQIIHSLEDFQHATRGWQDPIVADVETHPTCLLGVSICPASAPECPIYVPIAHYNRNTRSFDKKASEGLLNALKGLLSSNYLIGHNYVYDKMWIDNAFGINSIWMADTRIMWHLSAAPSGPFPYGLKDAQKQILGWVNRGDEELAANVKQYGGSLKKGDHYLADLGVLAKYACLDAKSTALLFNELEPFFKEHQYYWQSDLTMKYAWLLQRNTTIGVKADVEGLKDTLTKLETANERHYKAFLKELEPEIAFLEKAWLDRRIAAYKRDYNKTRLLQHPEEWQRFNPNSDKDKRELFYDVLKFPVIEKTKGGKSKPPMPSTSADAVKGMKHPFVAPYLEYEKTNTLISNFVRPYIASVGDGRLHPGFNICGTVSYRLSGFKPYLLNAPFDEKLIMRNFVCDDGFVGVHADLAAIEPTVTAHYSEDPSLLKVFKHGLGDIYLDLALELFPEDAELKAGYDPTKPITKAIKQKFDKQRKVAKVVQLAVQYTGTENTVAKSLNKAGIPTTKAQAKNYVLAYWRKFKKVKEFNYRLKQVYKTEGLLRNVSGRIIRLPKDWGFDHKDLPNRFIQSSAHDVLVLWVIKIYELCAAEGIEIRPVLIDCHDSTSNQVPAEAVERVQRIYVEALDKVNAELGLSVPAKMEMKTFTTLAGLKGDE